MNRVAIVAAISLFACAGATRKRAEYTAGGALIGVLGGSLAMAALPDHKRIIIPITIAFGGLAVAAVVVYVVAGEPPATEAPPRTRPTTSPAWPLTLEAQTAARAGRCDDVRALDARVRALDGAFHTAVFTRDIAIRRCLGQGVPEPSPP